MILGQSLLSVFKASIVMDVLLVASILAVGLILERFWYFTRNRFNPDKGLDEFQKQLTTSGSDKALAWARSQNSAVASLQTCHIHWNGRSRRWRSVSNRSRWTRRRST